MQLVRIGDRTVAVSEPLLLARATRDSHPGLVTRDLFKTRGVCLVPFACSLSVGKPIDSCCVLQAQSLLSATQIQC